MEDCHRKDTWHTRAEENADQIHTCVLLLDRIIKDEYDENMMNEHAKRWGELYTWWTDAEDPNYKCYNSSRPMILSPEDREQERKEFSHNMKHANKQREQDFELLFKIIKKHNGCWWV